jgi:triphosphatase
VETELKLTFPAEARAAIDRHPVLAEAEARAFAQHAVCYDTADLALRDAGFCLRVRSEGDVFTQTLKRDATAGGAATTSGEWEWQMRDETPDSDLLYKTPAAEFSGKALWPAFEIKVNRVVRRLGLPGDAEVELALDEGQIIAGSARAPIREMELELKSGSPGSLYRLAVRLHDALPLRILTESKAARGYKLKTGSVF